jgi:hypothetical protein
MEKRSLLSVLFVSFFIISVLSILLLNSRFNKTDFVSKNYLYRYLHRKEETNINDKMIDNKAEYVVVDRFEGNYAVCEDKNGEMINIDRTEIPQEAKEGSVLKIVDGGIEIDRIETTVRKNRILELMEALWK